VEVEVNQRARSRNTILLIAALFLTPMIIAWVVYSSVDDWGSRATRNHGDLVRPAKPLNAFDLQRQDGSPFTLEDMKHKWTIVYIGNDSCDQTCADLLYKTRQSRLAQGKEMSRVQRLFVLNQVQLSPAERSTIQTSHPELIVANGNENQLAGFIRQFAIDGKDVAAARRIYLVDPLGNLMMSYESDFKGEDLIKDLERLLRVSQIG
jgi:cytochrome oxidase Cu insertion factor (SCO1/SenC/PrrC family)